MTEARTEPYRPSNATAGEMFQQDWCYRCQREQNGRQCKILTATLIYGIDETGYPKEWVRDIGDWPGNPRCTAFKEPRAAVHHTLIKDKRQMAMFPAGSAAERAP